MALRVRLSEWSFASLMEKEGIHFDFRHGRAKAANGKEFEALTDEEVDWLLAQPEPVDTRRQYSKIEEWL